MYRNSKLRNYPITKSHNSSRGYILITLMLFFTVLAMAALAAIPEIVQQIKRDREEEMIHRGVQYTRAVQRYYKKFGRYPTRIEELESSNNLRFLRKRYKDPMTDKEFRLLRLGDPALTAMGFGQGFGQAGIQGAAAQVLAQQQNRPGMVAGPNGGVRPAGPGDANMPQVTGLPGTMNTVQQQPGGAADTAEGAGDSKSDASASSDSGPGSGFGGQVFGGGPIVGVVSSSKAQTIREFSNKNHYKDWPFIYDPSSDRGGLLNAPTQPNMGQGFSALGQAGGAAGQQGPQNSRTPGGQQPNPPEPQDSPNEQ